MRRPLIVGNWKMHKTATEAVAFVRDLAAVLPPPQSVEVVLAPAFTALAAVNQSSPASHRFGLGAQNLFWETHGPFTGEISAPMLTDLGCRYVIIGHSERRQQFGETDDGVNKKVKTALRHGLRPIVCVGESLAHRESGATDTVVLAQLHHGLAGVTAEHSDAVVIAYEPVWAIGTGRAATPEQAAAVHQALRIALDRQWGGDLASRTRILYGGSVTAGNAKAFLERPEIDGALVGGACLDPGSFATIVTLAQSTSQ